MPCADSFDNAKLDESFSESSAESISVGLINHDLVYLKGNERLLQLEAFPKASSKASLKTLPTDNLLSKKQSALAWLITEIGCSFESTMKGSLSSYVPKRKAHPRLHVECSLKSFPQGCCSICFRLCHLFKYKTWTKGNKILGYRTHPSKKYEKKPRKILKKHPQKPQAQKRINGLLQWRKKLLRLPN